MCILMIFMAAVAVTTHCQYCLQLRQLRVNFGCVSMRQTNAHTLTHKLAGYMLITCAKKCRKMLHLLHVELLIFVTSCQHPLPPLPSLPPVLSYSSLTPVFVYPCSGFQQFKAQVEKKFGRHSCEVLSIQLLQAVLIHKKLSRAKRELHTKRVLRCVRWQAHCL